MDDEKVQVIESTSTTTKTVKTRRKKNDETDKKTKEVKPKRPRGRPRKVKEPKQPKERRPRKPAGKRIPPKKGFPASISQGPSQFVQKVPPPRLLGSMGGMGAGAGGTPGTPGVSGPGTAGPVIFSREIAPKAPEPAVAPKKEVKAKEVSPEQVLKQEANIARSLARVFAPMDKRHVREYLKFLYEADELGSYHLDTIIGGPTKPKSKIIKDLSTYIYNYPNVFIKDNIIESTKEWFENYKSENLEDEEVVGTYQDIRPPPSVDVAAGGEEEASILPASSSGSEEEASILPLEEGDEEEASFGASSSTSALSAPFGGAAAAPMPFGPSTSTGLGGRRKKIIIRKEE